MLELKNIYKTFNKGTVNEKRVLKGLNLSLADGDFATIVGSNGAGKSTMFNAITGVFYVDSGEIILGGEDITFKKEYFRSKEIGHLFQDPMLGTAPHMTIEENMALAYLRASKGRHGYFSRVSKKDKAMFKEHLRLLDMGLEDRMKQPAGLLSGGQRQALTLIMATMVTPKLLLLDVKNRCWSKEMIEICGISEEMLPKLFESYEAVGQVKPEIAKQLGIKEEVKVVAGAGDNAAAAVGTGTVGDGRCNISLGTSGTIFIASKDFCVDKYNALHSFGHADGNYHLMGCMLSAAACNKWWLEGILDTKDYVKEQTAITNFGNNQVFYLPYLMGERSPHNDPFARAMFIGMSMDTSRTDMTQAVMEGIAFGLRDSLEVARSLGIGIQRTKICGGGAKSAAAKKIVANVMDLSVDVIESEEGPGYGAAILAAVGCGVFASVEEAADKLVKVTATVEPEKELVAKYEERYQKFRQIYPLVKDFYHTLGTN